MSNSELKPVAPSGAAILMAIAIFQRLFTFLLNTLLLRYVSADIIGFAHNDMELMLSTILFISRESCRIVAMRSHPDQLVSSDDTLRQQFVNIAWLPVPIGITLAAICSVAFMPKGSSAEEVMAFVTFALAAMVEVLSEPFYIFCNSALLYSVRAKADVAGVTCRCIVTFVLAAWFGWTWMSFAVGQLVYASIQLAVYAYQSVQLLRKNEKPISLLFPTLSPPATEQRSLLTGFFLQGVVKHLLTEGDRLLLMALTSRSDRGVYAVVVNYGSLPARFLFQPLEEALRNAVSKVTASEANEVTQRKHVKVLGEAVMRIVLFVGCLFAIFGSNLADVAANVGLGARWSGSNIGQVLSLYCIYVLFMACNGATEALCMAVADAARVRQSSIHMLAAFAGYTAGTYLLMPVFGVRAVVIANILNMALRTMSSAVYLHGWMARHDVQFDLSEMFASAPTTSLLAISMALFQISRGPAQAGGASLKQHLIIAAVCLGLVATTTILYDLHRLRKAWSTARGFYAIKAD